LALLFKPFGVLVPKDFKNDLALSVPDEGYLALSVPDEGCSSVPDEGY
jgi:hypothetical protein